MSGLSSIVAGDELFGLQRAFLYAVAPTVICTVAKARDRVTLLVMDRFYAYLLGLDGAAPARPAVALRDALIAVRTMSRDEANRTLARYDYPPLPSGGHPTDTPFAGPEYWAPFIVIGRP
jgi:CHAT domain-containing protein